VHMLTLRRESLDCCPVTAFEYRHATWGEVCELGPQGWRLVAIPPIVEMRQTALGQVQGGEPQYVMEREAPAVVTAQAAVTGGAFDTALTRSVQRQGRHHLFPQKEDGP
jgi:hypothetical protein